VKLDPGSKTTGIAVINDTTGQVVWAAELTHRGQQIRDRLLARRAIRRNRRQRKTRYRQPRFLDRRRPSGWLPPSLQHRVLTTLTWVARLRRWAPIAAISLELVRFDTQQLQDAEIQGVQYQQGELVGYEVRQYLLEKWQRHCAYCGVTDVPLEIEHLVPKSRGGSDRVSNLTVACHACNQRKGSQTAAEYGYPQLQAQAKQPLKDAAAVNSTRWALYQRLVATAMPVDVGTGGRTKYNRTVRGLPKTHWLDAACVGASTSEDLRTRGVVPLRIRATGHGTRQMCGTNASGIPIRHRQRRKRWFGFQTGDIVRAVVPHGKRAGVHVGRVLCRATGRFDISTVAGRQAGIHHRYCRVLHRQDGYACTSGGGASSHP
jgi:5-methylcytosine-specific restriction endonuclease McrA